MRSVKEYLNHVQETFKEKIYDPDAVLPKAMFDRKLLDVYIPSKAVLRHDSSAESDFGAEQAILNTLEADSDIRSTLVMANSGYGKTLLGIRIAHHLMSQKQWQQEDIVSPVIPLWVHLPSFATDTDISKDDLLDEAFSWYGLRMRHIEQLKQACRDGHLTLLAILDGFDELRLQDSILTANDGEFYASKGWFTQWPGLRILTLTRPEAFSALKNPNAYSKLFYPQPESHGEGFSEMWLQPFTEADIEVYLTSYVDPERAEIAALDEQWQRWQVYKDTLQRIHPLSRLAKSPIMLSIIVQALPRLVEEAAGENHYIYTRQRVYEIFVQDWIAKQAEHRIWSNGSDREFLKAAGVQNLQQLIDILMDYSRNLARSMWVHGKGKLDMPLDNDNTLVPDLFQRLPVAHDQPVEVLQVIPSGCILKCHGSSWRFLHKTITEFLAVRAIFQGVHHKAEALIREQADAAAGFHITQEMLDDLELSKGNIQLEEGVVEFLADLVKTHTDFKEMLYQVIYQSRSEALDSIAQAASNAITLLNWAGETFIGQDFHGVQIPYADLRRAIFDRANLQGANLRGSKMHNAWLLNSDLSNANLVDIETGMRPFLDNPRQEVFVKMSFDAKNSRLYTLDATMAMCVWDLVTQSQIYSWKAFTRFEQIGLLPSFLSGDGYKLSLFSVSLSSSGDRFAYILPNGKRCVRQFDGTKLFEMDPTVAPASSGITQEAIHFLQGDDIVMFGNEIWNLKELRCSKKLDGDHYIISPDKRFVLELEQTIQDEAPDVILKEAEAAITQFFRLDTEQRVKASDRFNFLIHPLLSISRLLRNMIQKQYQLASIIKQIQKVHAQSQAINENMSTQFNKLYQDLKAVPHIAGDLIGTFLLFRVRSFIGMNQEMHSFLFDYDRQISKLNKARETMAQAHKYLFSFDLVQILQYEESALNALQSSLENPFKVIAEVYNKYNEYSSGLFMFTLKRVQQVRAFSMRNFLNPDIDMDAAKSFPVASYHYPKDTKKTISDVSFSASSRFISVCEKQYNSYEMRIDIYRILAVNNIQKLTSLNNYEQPGVVLSTEPHYISDDRFLVCVDNGRTSVWRLDEAKCITTSPSVLLNSSSGKDGSFIYQDMYGRHSLYMIDGKRIMAFPIDLTRALLMSKGDGNHLLEGIDAQLERSLTITDHDTTGLQPISDTVSVSYRGNIDPVGRGNSRIQATINIVAEGAEPLELQIRHGLIGMLADLIKRGAGGTLERDNLVDNPFLQLSPQSRYLILMLKAGTSFLTDLQSKYYKTLNYVCGLSTDSRIWVIDLMSRSIPYIFSHHNQISSAAFSQDDAWLITAGHTLRVWDLATGKCLKKITQINRYVRAFALSDDKSMLAIFDGAGNLKLFETGHYRIISQIESIAQCYTTLAFTADGTQLQALTAEKDNTTYNLIRLHEASYALQLTQRSRATQFYCQGCNLKGAMVTSANDAMLFKQNGARGKPQIYDPLNDYIHRGDLPAELTSEIAVVEKVYSSVVKQRLPLSYDHWVVSLMRKRKSRNSEHAFLLIEAVDNVGKLAIIRLEIATSFDGGRKKTPAGKAKPLTTFKSSMDKEACRQFLFEKIFKTHSLTNLSEVMAYKTWSVTREQALNLYTMCQRDQDNGLLPYSQTGAASIFGARHNCYTYCREKLLTVDRERFEAELPLSAMDFIATIPSIHLVPVREQQRRVPRVVHLDETDATAADSASAFGGGGGAGYEY